MARRFQNQSTFRRSRPNRAWSGLASPTQTPVPAASKVLIGSYVLSNAQIDETVIRNVGVIGISSDQAAASELQIGAVGMILVTDVAHAAGVASIPGPITDIEDDGWLVYIPFCFEFRFVSGVGVEPDFSHLINFDSKAKRRVQEGSRVAVIAENAHATHAFRVMFVARNLTMISGTR